MYKHDNPQSLPALKDGVSLRSFMKNIFNTENTYSNTMVVLGEEPGLFDTIHKPHPFLWDKYKEAVSFNWSEDEFSFIECAAQFAKGDDVAAIMIDTLAWQWEADSIVSHTLLPLVAPFISNSELNACMAFNTYMECCHSACYSEIVRESFPDHESIIKTILDKQQAFERVSIAGEILQELHDVGHRYALGQVSREEAFPTVYMGMLALYLLERLQFIASFAITFAIGEAGLFQPIAMAVRKICSDEIQIHAEVDLYVLKEMQKMPWYEQAMENGLGNRVVALVNDVIQGEMEWTDKLFEGRSMVGVNADIIKDWVQFNAQIVKQELGLPWENLVKENPIPWINGWITLNNLQAAPQEQDMAQYLMGAVDSNLDGLDDIDL